MRLLNFYFCWNSPESHVTPKPFSSVTFHISLTLILYCGLFLIPVTAAPSDIIESHLLPTHGYTERDGGAISGTAQASLRRDQVGSPNTGESERSNRAHKEIFRLELLRQIKAIDHMKCFPKVLCGLSVDSDKSFGINKSNFVKSYLELMRNIKPPQEGVEERLRTEDEVEGELLWPFSPHNPDRKHHSSFERIGSGAMSASVELGDSPEYISRGLSSRMGDTSTSVEKVDRMGLAASAEESKEKFSSTGNKPSSHASITRMENSKIPGEKKKKDNADKSLTAKLTSYFTSWLPEISFVKDTEDESTEAGRDNIKRVARSMSDEENVRINSNWPLSRNYFLAQLSKMLESFKQQRVSSRQGRADEAFSTAAADHVLARDGIHGESAEHEGDIYHTAVNIGKRLKDPKQCDYIYNGCPLEYNKIMDMISSIRTDINPHDEAAEAVSHELGLEATPTTTTSTTTTTTTTTSTTTTRKPQRKKTRPSTKIMHTLPNGEKVEINFRLGGSEDSEESASSQRDYAKKETTDDDYFSSEKDNKGDGEVVVVDLGQRSTLSTDEVMSSEKRIISNRKGAPIDMAVVRNKSNKRKSGYSNSKKNIVSELSRTESLERTEELDIEQEDEVEVAKPSTNMASLLSAASFHNNKQKSALKLSGLTLTTNNNDEQPLEISPSYVIIKHQPLSVHTTSLLPPDNLPSPQQQIKPSDRLQSFQLIQNGQLIDADQLTDHLKNYIRQNGGIIPKLSLHSSGLLTTDSSDNSANTPNPYSLRQQLNPETQALISSASLKTQQSKPLTTLSLLNARPQPVSKPNLSHLSIPNQFKSALPQSPYSSYLSYVYNNGPAMVGSVPGRLDSLHKATTPSPTTTTTTPSTYTQSIILPGMQETLMLDTHEITDDTMDKLSAHGTVPTWITPSPTASSVEIRANKESEEEQTMLENLNKTYLNESGTRTRYKNPKKKKTVVKSNSSRVRNPPTSKRNKGTKKGNNKYSSSSASEESAEGERVVIKHAGPYSGSPTVYQSPLKGSGPHGGAYPYLPVGSMKPNVFPGYPFWRL